MPTGTGLANPTARITQRYIYGSPSFRFANAAIAASGSEIFDLESRSGKQAKYLPFDSIEILNNNSTSTVEILLNQDSNNTVPVLPKSNKVLSNLAVSYNSFTIKNLDTSNALSANDIIVICSMSSVNADSVAQLNEGERAQGNLGLIGRALWR